MRRGEIWWARLSPPWGRRPVLLVARNQAYDVLSWAMVAPLTTTIRDAPTMVRLDPRSDGVHEPCIVNLDAIQVARADWFETLITRLRPEKMQDVERAIHFALGLSD